MPACANCGSSYSDEFRFCPHCGTAKPEPTTIHVRTLASPTRYEEAELRLLYLGEHATEIGDGIRKGFFGWSDSSIEVYFCEFALEASPPRNDDSYALRSDRFRVTAPWDKSSKDFFRLGEAHEIGIHKSRWFADFRPELEAVWKRFRASLALEGWQPVTEYAVQGRIPSQIGVNRREAMSLFLPRTSWEYATKERAQLLQSQLAANLDLYRYCRSIPE